MPSNFDDVTMTDVFLSYAREDLERARVIARALESEGWSVSWDRRIPPGREWDDYVEEQINQARVVVVMWSPHSVTSKWVKIEAAYGRDRNALIPITIAPATIPFAFRHLQAADLCAWQPGERSVEYEDVLVEIGRLAPRGFPGTKAPQPAVSAAASTTLPAMAGLPDEVVLPTNPLVHLVKIPAGSFLMEATRRRTAAQAPTSSGSAKAKARSRLLTTTSGSSR